MKRFTEISFVALSMFVTAISCTAEQDDEVILPLDNKVVISATFPETTKIAVSDNGEALELTWKKSDYLTVVSGDKSEKFEMISCEGNVATFSGFPIEGDSFDILLSRSDNSYIERSYRGQIQSSVASTDHLEYDVVLRGVTDYNAVSFTYDWAEIHGGELLQSGCLLLHFQMPEDAGHIRFVSLSTEDNIFYETNSADGEKINALSLELDNADMHSDNIVKAYIMTSMQEANIPAETELTLTVVSNLGTWSKVFTPGESVLQAGKKNIIKLNKENWTVPTGDGSIANPYILRNAEDLRLMSSKLGAEKKYVAMVNDIDASSVTEWPSISYSKLIDFNGNNRTIYSFKPSKFKNDYSGLVAVLNGRIANLTITGAEVKGNDSKACGILCGYLGRANGEAYGEIENVHIEGTINGTGKGVGGLVGILGNGKIKKCSANVNVSSTKDDVGGLVGHFNDGGATNVCEISDCWTAGAIMSETQRVGGIIGEVFSNADIVNTNTASIKNSYSIASVEGLRAIGGITGYATSSELTSVINCIAWNDKIVASGTKYSQHSSGAIVGRTNTLHTLKDCYRKSDINYSCVFTDVELAATVCDQENVDKEHKLIVGTSKEEGSTYGDNWYPYHGKAAAANATVSTVAKSLGWDETIWDLSGSLPQLIR